MVSYISHRCFQVNCSHFNSAFVFLSPEGVGEKGAAEWGLMFPAEFNHNNVSAMLLIPAIKASEDCSPTWLLFF